MTCHRIGCSIPIEFPVTSVTGTAGAAGSDGSDGNAVLFSNTPAAVVATETTDYEVFTGMTYTVADLTNVEGKAILITSDVIVPDASKNTAGKYIKITIDGKNAFDIEVPNGVTTVNCEVYGTVDDAGNMYLQNYITFITPTYNTEEVYLVKTISITDITSFVVNVMGHSAVAGDLTCKNLNILLYNKS